MDIEVIRSGTTKDKLALTIDTSIFRQYQLNFKTGPISLLQQFCESPVKLVFSDVTLAEIEKSLREKLDNVRRDVLKAAKSLADFELELFDIQQIELLNTKNAANEIIQSFVKRCAVTKVSCESACLNIILEKYFNNRPPFSTKKKNEFPDAIVLDSLEKWGATNHASVIAVSKDRDWQEYCQTSSCIAFINSLTDALSLIQDLVDENAQKFVENISLFDYRSKLEHELLNNFESIVQIHAEGHSRFYYEYPEVLPPDAVDIDLNGYDLKVVSYTENEIIVEGECDVVFEVEAQFPLAVYDSVDKDYTGVGSATASKRIEETLSFLLHFESNESRHFSLGFIEFVPVAVTYDFGELQPDWF